MHSFLQQRVDTFISIAFVGAVALGASYLIISFANKEDFAMAAALREELGELDTSAH